MEGRSMLGKPKLAFIVCIFAGLALVSCLPVMRNEPSNIYGRYVGNHGMHKEVLTLSESGQFIHEMNNGKDLILSETGTFELVREQVKFYGFTQFYNPLTKKIDDNGEKFGILYLNLLVGDPFNMLKPALDQEYFLKQQKSERGQASLNDRTQKQEKNF